MPAAACFDTQAERLGDLLRMAAYCRIAIELHASAEEIVGRDDAQHHVGVGHRGKRAAAAVADGPGLGAGAFGPDAQQSTLDARDRSAAGADGADVDHRRVEVVAAGLMLGRNERLAVDDDRDVEAGAAHIGGDDIAMSRGPWRDCSEPSTPPVGPLATSSTGRRAASSAGMTPPALLRI